MDVASAAQIAELLREGNEPICYVEVGGVFWALLLLGRGEVHGFGFGWGVALSLPMFMSRPNFCRWWYT